MVDFPPQPDQPTDGVPGWYRHNCDAGFVRYWNGTEYTSIIADDPNIPGYGVADPRLVDDDPENDKFVDVVGEEPLESVIGDPSDNPWEAKRQERLADGGENSGNLGFERAEWHLPFDHGKDHGPLDDDED